MVRHQLPLPGPRVPIRTGVLPRLDQTARRVPRSEEPRHTYPSRPVLLGPVTFLLLGKSRDAAVGPLALLPGLIPVYVELLRRLAAAGGDWVQIDEPCLVLDERARLAVKTAYETLAGTAPALKLLITTYFGALGENLETALNLPVASLHLDLVRGPKQLDEAIVKAPTDRVLSLGVVDGRNIWRSDLAAILDRIEPVVARRGFDRVMLAPSCSLLHVPIDLPGDRSPP